VSHNNGKEGAVKGQGKEKEENKRESSRGEGEREDLGSVKGGEMGGLPYPANQGGVSKGEQQKRKKAACRAGRQCRENK